MKVLIVTTYYPYADYPSWGIYSERCACVLRELCEEVEVLAPRPYVPPAMSLLSSRWKSYSRIPHYEVNNGIPVYRPSYVQVPGVGGVFWADPGTFFWCRRTARKMHSRARFDAIISFDLVGSGGLAWRIGRDLGIVASGWAIGSDVRVPVCSSYERSLMRTVTRLDLVFYQSQELLEIVAKRLGVSPLAMLEKQHVVLARGIPQPPLLPRADLRNRIREEWGIPSDHIVVLNVGRIVRSKGIFELLDAISSAAHTNPKITCVLVGSKPGFDETVEVQNKLNGTSSLRGRVIILPNCSTDKVWKYLCAADVFAFPSHREGMPNALLEAMAMGLPAITFAIPPVLEIEAGTECIVTVPPFNSALFSEAIVRLAASPKERTSIAERGKTRVTQHFMVADKMVEALASLEKAVEKRAA